MSSLIGSSSASFFSNRLWYLNKYHINRVSKHKNSIIYLSNKTVYIFIILSI
jgi:hypothetical protein